MTGQVGANLADVISEETLLRLAHNLSLGLDCNVPLMAYKEAVELLFSELQKGCWKISPPVPRTPRLESRGRHGYGENTLLGIAASVGQCRSP